MEVWFFTTSASSPSHSPALSDDGWSQFRIHTMVGVAQVVEPQVVALVVVGSSPITHPIKNLKPGRINLPGYKFAAKTWNLTGIYI